MLNICSWGGGVQSSTLLIMSDRGMLPKLDAAVFSDTRAEPAEVYRWVDYVRERITSFPIFVVSRGNLYADSLVLKRSGRSGKLYQKNLIPYFLKNPDGSDGFLHRKCTSEYKIREVVKKARELVGPKLIRDWHRDTRKGLAPPPLMRAWIGISSDESQRAKPSPEGWIENHFPLLEKSMSRDDCLRLMHELGFPRPPRSSCVFCPYHSDAEWFRLKSEHPADFARAVQFERDAQRVHKKDEAIKATGIYLHASRVPLSKVTFNPKDNAGYTCDGFCSI